MEKTTGQGALCSVLFTTYNSGNQVKKTEKAGHVARMGERRYAYRALMGKPEGRRPLERSGVDGRIILKLIFERLDGRAWTGSI